MGIWGAVSGTGYGLPDTPPLVHLLPPLDLVWLIVSTIVASLAAVATFPLLLASTMAFDLHHGELPRVTYLFGLFSILPVVAGAAIIGAWACFALDLPRLARYLALGPWIVGLGLVATTAILIAAAMQGRRQ